jgi:D-alanyl-D-alanine carboxypeptidase
MSLPLPLRARRPAAPVTVLPFLLHESPGLLRLPVPFAVPQAQQPPKSPPAAFLLLDVTANQMLAAEGHRHAVEPASLTKLMTAYLVFDALRAKKIDLTQTCRSASGPGRWGARGCSSTRR